MVWIRSCSGCSVDENRHYVATGSTLRDTMRGYILDLNRDVTRHLATNAVESLKLDFGEIHPLTMQVETVDIETKPSEPTGDGQ